MKKQRVLTQPQKKSRTFALNVICIIFTVIFTAVFILQFSVRSILKNDSVKDEIKNIDYSQITVQVEDGRLPFDTYINEYYVLDESITDEDINNLLSKSTAHEFLESKYDSLMQYLLGGSYKIPTITPQEIADELDKNKDLIYESSSIRFLSDDHHELIAALEGPLNSFNASISESSVVSLVKYFCSPALIIFDFVLLAIVIFVWMLNYSKLNEKSFPALRNFGISVCVSSIAVMVFLFAKSSNPPKILGDIKAIDISDYVSNSFVKCAMMSFIPMAAGILIIVLSLVIAIIHKKTYIGSDDADIEYNYDDGKANSIFSSFEKSPVEMDTVYSQNDNIEINSEDYEETEISDEESKDAVDELLDSIESGKPLPEHIEHIPEEVAAATDKPVNKPVKENEEYIPTHEAPEISMPEINSPSAIPVNGRTCKKCGKVNLSRNLFCSECGELLQ